MKFKVISEEDAESQASGLWPDGTYDYEVNEATEKTSPVRADGSGGNDMIELQVSVFDSAGNRRQIFDYLVSTDKSAWKIRHFAASCGMLPQYTSGSLMASEMIGRAGRCEVETQKARDGFPAKNKIKDYLPQQGSQVRRQPQASRVSGPPADRWPQKAADLGDEIPF